VTTNSAKVWVDTEGAAAFLSRSRRTLEDWRRLRVGPNYYKVRRAVRYSLADLQAFMESNHVDAATGRQAVEHA
jgi:hypothetical protein